ncbi:MAG: response regulator [Stellaceae bacterium]
MTKPALQRVLYVDDEPDIREIAGMALKLDGTLSVRSCDSGKQALEQASQFRPDIILLDVMMPGMDGPSTLQALKQIPDLAAVPIVFVTAKAQRQEVERFLALGAVSVISKPFDPMTLADQVRAIWQVC